MHVGVHIVTFVCAVNTNMNKVVTGIVLCLITAGCVDATRTIPVINIEQRPINIPVEQIEKERTLLVVPVERSNLPPPTNKPIVNQKPFNDTVLRDWKTNNYR